MNIDDTDLLAYADGQLPSQRRAEVEAAITASPELTARVNTLRASALPYAAAFQSQALPPVPEELSQSISNLISADAQRQQHRRSSWPRMAAAFAAGVLCCAIALRLLAPGASPPSTAQVAPWIKAVADYQQLYSRATLANLTENPQLSRQVIDDLRSNDGMRVTVPDLRSAGLTFKRVQRLSFHDRPVVQMVYLPEHGEPIAVCATPDARPDEPPHAQQLGEMGTVAWRSGNVGYVLLGRDSTQALMELGHRIASGATSSLYGHRTAPPLPGLMAAAPVAGTGPV
jgi:anti-sigma factor RsiW